MKNFVYAGLGLFLLISVVLILLGVDDPTAGITAGGIKLMIPVIGVIYGVGTIARKVRLRAANISVLLQIGQ